MFISLRQVKLDDAEMIYAWKQDSLFKKMAQDLNFTTSIKEQSKDIEKSINSMLSDYVIILKDYNAIGYIRIDYIDNEKMYSWLRFALGKERGKCYMKEALRIYLSDIFIKGCHRVEAEVYDFNIPSCRLLESLGFVKEGCKRKAHMILDGYVDIFVYGLLKDELK